ncbi:MAG: hypothetical protein BRD34_03375 [Bacteroidetes bacterium QH_6_64_77]|nr:MAG: hypothetical protein BRD34_03375 [Bacteroidetes bacterium QH_6_64_77]
MQWGHLERSAGVGRKRGRHGDEDVVPIPPQEAGAALLRVGHEAATLSKLLPNLWIQRDRGLKSVDEGIAVSKRGDARTVAHVRV